MEEYDIALLTKEQMLDEDFMNEIFKNYKGEERDEILEYVLIRSRELNIQPKIKKEISRCAENEKGKNKLVQKTESGELIIDMGKILSWTSNGNVEVKVENFKNILIYDKEISQHIRFNLLSDKFEYWENGIGRNWRDSDDARICNYIENKYDIYSDDKYHKALDTTREFFEYHPVKKLIEQEEWDGTPRIDRFLIDIMKCEDDDYSREVARMIFYGGIHRIYDPGCKFDYMPILIGKQGSCKSSIVEWLNISNSFYREVLSIDGAKGIESINGGWICEFSELQGMIRAKDVEGLKGYVTRTVDNYRPAYGRNIVSVPRQCIFIGTTNDSEFLSDMTGNRRYLPIEIGLEEGGIYKRKEFVKDYILQCWREAKHLMDEGLTYLVIPNKFKSILQEHQENVTIDDPSIGIIKAYLNSKEVGYKVCAMEIYTQCLNGISKNFTRMTSQYITRIMNDIKDWDRRNGSYPFKDYGNQRYWIKLDTNDLD